MTELEQRVTKFRVKTLLHIATVIVLVFFVCCSPKSAFISESHFESKQRNIGLQPEGSVLQSPHHLSADTHGIIYVSDIEKGQILRFDTEGSFIGEFATDQNIIHPSGISNGQNFIAIIDDSRHQLLVFDKNGNTNWATNDKGQGLEQLFYPKSVAVNPENNNIFVADYGNLRIQEFSSAGIYIKSFIFRSPLHNINQAPRAIAIHKNELFALYPESLEIAVFNLHSTELLHSFSNQTIPQKPLANPKDICLNTDGYLFISDEGKNSIIVLDKQGELQDTINLANDGLHGSNQLEGIYCDALGNVYVTDKKNQRIITLAARTELRLTRQAQFAYEAGHMEDALSTCEKLLQINPQNSEAINIMENALRLMIGKALSEKNHLEAKKLLNQLLSFNPANKFALRRIRLLRWAENKGWMKYAFAGLTCFLLFFATLLTILDYLRQNKNLEPSEQNLEPSEQNLANGT